MKVLLTKNGESVSLEICNKKDIQSLKHQIFVEFKLFRTKEKINSQCMVWIIKSSGIKVAKKKNFG